MMTGIGLASGAFAVGIELGALARLVGLDRLPGAQQSEF
jgi:hypothetical protein